MRSKSTRAASPTCGMSRAAGGKSLKRATPTSRPPAPAAKASSARLRRERDDALRRRGEQ